MFSRNSDPTAFLRLSFSSTRPCLPRRTHSFAPLCHGVFTPSGHTRRSTTVPGPINDGKSATKWRHKLNGILVIKWASEWTTIGYSVTRDNPLEIMKFFDPSEGSICSSFLARMLRLLMCTWDFYASLARCVQFNTLTGCSCLLIFSALRILVLCVRVCTHWMRARNSTRRSFAR